MWQQFAEKIEREGEEVEIQGIVNVKDGKRFINIAECEKLFSRSKAMVYSWIRKANVPIYAIAVNGISSSYILVEDARDVLKAHPSLAEKPKPALVEKPKREVRVRSKRQKIVIALEDKAIE